MSIGRRGFLAIGAAGLASAQTPPVMPPPAKAKITSSVMLWTLPGTFEERVKAAALSGIQGVGLLDEYAMWDEAGLRNAKRYIESFGMSTETLLATPDWASRPVRMVNPADRDNFLKDFRAATRTAKQMEIPYVILLSGNEIPGHTREQQYASLLEGAKRAGDLAAAAGLTAIVAPLNNKVDYKGFYLTTCTEALKLIKDVDNPHVRLLFNVYHEQLQQGNVASTLRDALEYTAVVQIADSPGRNEPGSGSTDFREIYQVLSKGGYNHSVAMEYLPKGAPVASLKKAVDSFRAAVNERVGSASPTEGALV